VHFPVSAIGVQLAAELVVGLRWQGDARSQALAGWAVFRGGRAATWMKMRARPRRLPLTAALRMPESWTAASSTLAR
jgi:hypothetical protein